MSDIQNKVIDVICETLVIDKEDVEPDDDIHATLGADSLEQVQLAQAFENEFGIEISPKDAEHLTTPAKAAAYIESRLSGVPVA